MERIPLRLRLKFGDSYLIGIPKFAFDYVIYDNRTVRVKFDLGREWVRWYIDRNNLLTLENIVDYHIEKVSGK